MTRTITIFRASSGLTFERGPDIAFTALTSRRLEFADSGSELVLWLADRHGRRVEEIGNV